jgi:DNA-binding response OmpR family regulator
MTNAQGTFRRRVLLVDGDVAFLQECSNALQTEGYEVLTAEDGFVALHTLRGAKPDVLITELNLPHMSGFELLSVVRTRFPAISVLAISGEYTAASLPNEVICDGFVQKGPSTCFEIVEWD